MNRMTQFLYADSRWLWLLSISVVALLLGSTASAQEPGRFFEEPPSQTAPSQQPRLPRPQAPRGVPYEDPFRNNQQSQTGENNGAFDQQDPTQAAPDMRRILEGEQEQIQREPPPAIEVVGKVIGSEGAAKALLRVNGRYYMVEKGTRFSLPTSMQPLVYTVKNIDAKGVELEGGESKTVQRLQ